jgi:hypothetical protein
MSSSCSSLEEEVLASCLNSSTQAFVVLEASRLVVLLSASTATADFVD